MTTTRTLTCALVACAFLTVAATAGAAPPAEEPAPAEQPGTTGPDSALPPDHQHGDDESEASPSQQQMLEDIEAINSELDLLVGKMDAATGEAKLDAMADLLVVLVRQRGAMCSMMMSGKEQPMGRHPSPNGQRRCCP